MQGHRHACREEGRQTGRLASPPPKSGTPSIFSTTPRARISRETVVKLPPPLPSSLISNITTNQTFRCLLATSGLPVQLWYYCCYINARTQLNQVGPCLFAAAAAAAIAAAKSNIKNACSLSSKTAHPHKLARRSNVLTALQCMQEQPIKKQWTCYEREHKEKEAAG